jgi:hypothetical protein
VQLREADFALKLAYPQVQAALVDSGLGTFDVLVKQYFTNRTQIERYLGDGPMLRDDKPVTEYFLSMPTDSKPVDLTPFAGQASEILRR